MGNYWARHLPPSITSVFCTRVDDAVQMMVLASTQLTSSTLTEITKERMRLPITFKGMGLRSLYDRRHVEYIGGMIQGIPTLLNRISPSGINIKGRLHTESMVRWLGINPFSADPDKAPWNVILSQGIRSSVGSGLREAWETLQDTVIDINRMHEMECPIELLNI